MILYHGSDSIVKSPEYGKGKFYNDYGRGFYCTENKELAKEWACTEDYIGFVNAYGLDVKGLRILDLTRDEYSALNWLSILIEKRGTRIGSPIAKHSYAWLKEHFYIDVEEYDVIIGYRADDSYFAFARAFLNNGITYRQFCYALTLGGLGEQVVLKSEKAFQQLKYIEYEKVDKIYLQKRRQRDSEARRLYIKEMDKEDVDGMYIKDMIREGMTSNESLL